MTRRQRDNQDKKTTSQKLLAEILAFRDELTSNRLHLPPTPLPTGHRGFGGIVVSTPVQHVVTHGMFDLTSPDETAQALLDDIFTSLNQTDQRIHETQKFIDVIKVETRGMLDQLKELV